MKKIIFALLAVCISVAGISVIGKSYAVRAEAPDFEIYLLGMEDIEGKLVYDFEIFNNTGETENVTLIFVHYSNPDLGYGGGFGTKTVSHEIEAGTSEEYSFSFIEVDEENPDYKIFIWNGFDDMVPLMPGLDLDGIGCYPEETPEPTGTPSLGVTDPPEPTPETTATPEPTATPVPDPDDWDGPRKNVNFVDIVTNSEFDKTAASNAVAEDLAVISGLSFTSKQAKKITTATGIDVERLVVGSYYQSEAGIWFLADGQNETSAYPASVAGTYITAITYKVPYRIVGWQVDGFSGAAIYGSVSKGPRDFTSLSAFNAGAVGGSKQMGEQWQTPYIDGFSFSYTVNPEDLCYYLTIVGPAIGTDMARIGKVTITMSVPNKDDDGPKQYTFKEPFGGQWMQTVPTAGLGTFGTLPNTAALDPVDELDLGVVRIFVGIYDDFSWTSRYSLSFNSSSSSPYANPVLGVHGGAVTYKFPLPIVGWKFATNLNGDGFDLGVGSRVFLSKDPVDYTSTVIPTNVSVHELETANGTADVSDGYYYITLLGSSHEYSWGYKSWIEQVEVTVEGILE